MPDTFRHCNAGMDGHNPVKTQSAETKNQFRQEPGKVEAMNKIDKAIEKKMMKSGAMGTEIVTVGIQLTDDEIREFFNCMKYDSENHLWEFQGNVLIISYTEVAGMKDMKKHTIEK